jgi:hypothetical protein
VLKWGILILLPLTISWKLVARPVDSGEFNRQPQLEVAEFLVRQHFVVTVSEQVEEGRPAILATAGACRMLIAMAPALGWNRDMIRRNATVADRVFIVFAGETYEEQPTWLTVPDFLWARFKRELGLKAAAAPLFVVIATETCAAERLPWNELA